VLHGKGDPEEKLKFRNNQLIEENKKLKL